MKHSLWFVLIVLWASSEAVANDAPGIEFGIEYEFGGQSGVRLFANSRSTFGYNDPVISSKLYFTGRDGLVQNLSCVPAEGEETCKVGATNIIVYLIALPASLYLYKEAFEAAK